MPSIYFIGTGLGEPCSIPAIIGGLKQGFFRAFYLTNLTGQFGLKADSAAPGERTADFARTVSTAG